MWYVIYAQDVPDSLATRMQVRPAHLERVQALQEEGRLLVAGPMPRIDADDPGPAGFSGSLIIARFGSLEDARTWAEADPYLATGAWSRVDVMPFRQVMP